MITILNRKELLITTDLNRQAEVRDLLAANRIDYAVKTTNLLNAQAAGSRRGRLGSLGIRQDAAYEYKFYVHKKEYEKAVNLIK